MTLGRNEKESEAFMHVRPRINAARSLRALLTRMWQEGFIIQAHHVDYEMKLDHWDIVYAPWVWNTERGPRKKDQLVGSVVRMRETGEWRFKFKNRQDPDSWVIFLKLAKDQRRYDRIVNAAIAVEWWQNAE